MRRSEPPATFLETRLNVHFSIEQGPKIAFEYSGVLTKCPRPFRKKFCKSGWTAGLKSLPSRKASRYLLRYYRDKGYLEARVSGMNESQDPEERHYAFHIEEGQKYSHPKWVFEGVDPPPDVSDNAGTIMEDPEAVKEQIESSFRGKGFLDAKSTVPKLVIEQGRT